MRQALLILGIAMLCISVATLHAGGGPVKLASPEMRLIAGGVNPECCEPGKPGPTENCFTKYPDLACPSDQSSCEIGPACRKDSSGGSWQPLVSDPTGKQSYVTAMAICTSEEGACVWYSGPHECKCENTQTVTRYRHGYSLCI